MPKVKLTIGRVFSYLVATEPHWPRISSILMNFLRYSLSCFSPKIHLQNLWKPFQFVLDQNLCHFEAILFDRAEIFDLEMPLEDGETQPDYPRPPCATSFFKSGLIRILHQYFTHFLRPVHTRELAPAAHSCNTLPEQSSLVCTNDF